MAQTKHEIQSILARAGGAPRHRFGQNFMIDQNLVRLVADAGMIQPGDLVIEVGPGTGTLTEEILSRGASVVAVEIDRDLARLLRERFAGEPRFELLEGDALAGKHALNRGLAAKLGIGETTKLVANLPYSIASPLIIELLIAGVDLLAFTVQREVGERIRGQPGTDAYGPLSVMAQMLAEIEMLRVLPPQAFWPAPKVESALLRLARRDRLGGQADEFSRFVGRLFSFRRKTLRKALAQAGFDAHAMLTQTRFDPQARPEVLTPENLLALFAARRAA
jgi:16S rRNA (adenine1518-N6/adenine1519-N6)-dimethyltransferase